MAKIVVHLDHTIEDGEKVTFKAPVNSESHSTLKIYYPIDESGQTETSAEFTIKDAMGESQSSKGGLFVTGSYVTVAIDTTNNIAYLHNSARKFSNPNLLDNWYFIGGGSQQTGKEFPINQRGETSYSGANYYIDRWRSSNAYGAFAVNADSVAFSATGGTYAFFRQYIRPTLEGTYTLSAYVKGSGGSLQTLDSSGNILSNKAFSASAQWTLVTLTSTTSGTPIRQVSIRVANGDTVNLQAVKLEKGYVSTLENDGPPHYGEQMQRCLSSMADTGDTYSAKTMATTEDVENTIAAKVPNFNFLDNPYFSGGGTGDGVLPVNQRGSTSYSGEGYTIDRWKISGSSGALAVNSGSVTFSATGGAAYFEQSFERPLRAGKEYTFSAMVKNGSLALAIYDDGDSAWHRGTIQTVADTSMLYSFTYTPTGTISKVGFYATSGQSIEIIEARMERGNRSTLTPAPIPKYGEELAKCQRFFTRIQRQSGIGYIGTGVMLSSYPMIIVPLPVTMRTATPTVTYGGTLTLYSGAGSSQNITEIKSGARLSSNSLAMQVDASALPSSGAAVILALYNSAAHIDISCDL